MRIFHLTPTFSPFSGIDRVVFNLAQRQAADGHQVSILALAGDMLPPNGVTLQELGMPETLLGQRLYRLLMFFDRSKINRAVALLQGADTIYSHQYPMNLLALAARRKYHCEYVYYDYGVPPAWTFSNLTEKIYITIFRRLTMLTARSANRAISISRFLQQDLFRQTKLRSTVEYCQVGSLFHEGIDGKSVRELNQSGNDPVVLYVGRISPHKGVHVLLAAFQELLKSVPAARLLIVGQPTYASYQRRLERLATDATKFLGFIPDEQLPEYYAAATVYATASLWEGFDLPIAEAQACGKRVVAFDVGSHREVINQNGILVPSGDIAGFSKALATVIASGKL